MQGLKTIDCLDQYAPNLVFLEQLFSLLMLEYLLVQVAIIRVLHYNAEFIKKVPQDFILHEYLLVPYDVIIFY